MLCVYVYAHRHIEIDCLCMQECMHEGEGGMIHVFAVHMNVCTCMLTRRVGQMGLDVYCILSVHACACLCCTPACVLLQLKSCFTD